MIEASAVQLQIIEEIRDLLRDANVAWWLFGGWAVDFHLGKVTRDHGDIEFYIWRDDAGAVSSKLQSAGFAPQDIPYPDEAIEFRKGAQLVCAVLLARNDGGDVVVPGRWTHWPWPDGAFADERAFIGGLDVPIVSAEALLDARLNYQAHAPGAPPLRERDMVAIQHLRSVIASRTSDDW